MNTSFKANAAQHKAFIAKLKTFFNVSSLKELKSQLYFDLCNHNWAINDIITFFTATGKYFVVRASDLLVSVDEANNATEPYPLSREELLAELKSAEIYQLQEETGYSRQEVIDLLDKAPARNSIGSLTEVDSPDDAFDTDDLYWDIESSLEEDTDNSRKGYNENWWQSDTFCYSDAIINTCENLAKAILDKCSANNLPIPTSIDEVNSFVDSTSIESFQATMIYPYWTVYTIDNVQHKVFTCSNTEECLIGIIQSVAKDSSVDNDNSLDDDSHLLYADNTVLVSADDDTDDEILRYKEIAAPSMSDMFAIMHSNYERDLQAAKILFHYWALSGNSYPLPNKWNSLRDFVISNNGSIDIGSTLCPARKEYFRTKDLNINGKIFFLWELRELEESIGDDAAIDYNEDGFFQLLNITVAEKYGVHSWFTREDIQEYQQNYRIISENCQQVIEIHEQSNTIADNGLGEYLPFPTNTDELHNLVATLYNTEEADQVIHNCIGDEYLFFQVLATMNFINSTASTVEA